MQCRRRIATALSVHGSRSAERIARTQPSNPRSTPLIGNVKISLPNEKHARKVRDLRQAAILPPVNSMTHAFHIDAYPSSPKRDARLHACRVLIEVPRIALPTMGSKRNSFGTTTID